MSDAPLLELRGVEKHYSQATNILDSLLGGDRDPVQAVDGVSLSVEENQVEGIIGESGCGKSTLLTLLMGLEEPTGGDVYFEGEPMSEFSRGDWKEYRRRVQLVFQDPFNSLDPKLTVEESLREPLAIHGLGDRDERVHTALERAELNPPGQYLDTLPRELSGGEKQRASIARALVMEPDVLLADEPVSMLDVSTQAAVLNLLSELVADLGMAMFYVSHDLSTVGYLCDYTNVMYLGRVVERADTGALLDDPKHPYTQALVNAIPIPDPHHDRERTTLEGTPPDPIGIGDGCRFRDRCPERMDVCDVTPEFREVDPDHYASCHLYYDHHADGAAGEVAADGGRATLLAADSGAPGAAPETRVADQDAPGADQGARTTDRDAPAADQGGDDA